MELVSATDPIGGELRGLDLAAPMSAQTFDELAGHFYDRSVLVVRDQQLSGTDLLRFARRFGEPDEHFLSHYAHPEHPDILLISNVVEAGKPVGFADAESWEGKADLTRAAEAAAAALPTYLAGLDALETTTSIHIGEPAARELVRLRCIDLSLEELHQLATDFLRETRETLTGLRSTLAPKHGLSADIPLAELHKALNEKSMTFERSAR